MTDRPILFSAPMVKALLAGTKTQTRRVLKPQLVCHSHDDWPAHPNPNPVIDEDGLHCGICGAGIELSNDTKSGVKGIPIRFGKGDRLWVRENLWLYGRWRQEGTTPKGRPRQTFDLIGKVAAFEKPADIAYWGGKEGFAFRPGIHMPRWASRLTLTVTDVRVQRLQEISEADCIAEGIETVADNFGNGAAYRDYGLPDRADSAEWYRRPIDSFRSLWVKINGGASWVASPWIVALTFTVDRRNIDAARAA